MRISDWSSDVCSSDLAGATRVVAAMSGGVDSSVAAALLHAEGYEVVGITLQLYDHGMALAKKGACCAGQDIYDARQVAERLGIPHYVLDYESRSEERRVGKECVSTCRSRWSQYHKKKKRNI